MKYLDPTHATNTAQQPVKNGTLQFLQDAHKENLANLFRGIIGPSYNTNTVYRLWGGSMNITSFNQPYTITVQAGAYFYNGEVFSSDLHSCYVNVGQQPLWAIQTTQYTPSSPLQADPVTFTDGTQYNIHNIRTIKAVAGPAGGSGVANYVGDCFASPTINILIETPIVNGHGLASVATNYPNIDINVPALNLVTTGALTQSGSWPNITLNVPVPPPVRNMVLCAGNTIITNAGQATGDVAPPSGNGYCFIDFANASPALINNTIADYFVAGSLRSLQPNNSYRDPTVQWTVTETLASGFKIWLQEFQSVQQDISLDWICFLKT